MYRLLASFTVCPICGVFRAGRSAACARCIDELFNSSHLSGLLALCRYDGSLEQAVRPLNFPGVQCLALPLAGELACQVKLRDWRPSALTCVPLHPARQRERGYNQAQLLARHAALILDLPFVQLLQRARANWQQARLPTLARRANTASAFALHAATPAVLPRTASC